MIQNIDQLNFNLDVMLVMTKFKVFVSIVFIVRR